MIKLNILPDCMMPDGADPCAGYHELQDNYDKLEAEVKRYREALELLFTVFHEDDVVKTHEAKAIIAAKAALDGDKDVT